MATLTNNDIQQNLEKIPQWEVVNETFISRSYNFHQFMDGLDFAYEVGRTAEKMNHHPSIQVEYGEVILAVTSHDEGGLTEKDFNLAQECDGIFEKKKG